MRHNWMKKLMCLWMVGSVCLSVTVSVEAKVMSEKLGYKVLATSQHEAEQIAVKSYKVSDGDTVQLDLADNRHIKARLLLIDTPELHHSKNGKQLYSEEAKNRLEALLKQADKIAIEYDENKDEDKYKRDVVYLWVDGILVQEVLVTEGFARVNYIYPPNIRYLDVLRESEAYAKRNQLNIWSGPEVFADEVKDKSQSKIASPSSAPNAVQQAGAVAPAAAGIVAPAAAAAIQPEVHYRNCKEVKAAGAAPIRPGDPGWDPKFDRDGDGIGCER